MKHTRGIFGLVIFLAGLVFGGPSAGAFEFVYRYRAGDKYRIVSTVKQDIYVNRVLGYRAEFLNRISMEITGVHGAGDRATFSAVFQTAERTFPVEAGGRIVPARPPEGSFQWSRDYHSVFEQDMLGYITIDDEYYMPMVRDVPVFPGRPLNPGERWNAMGMDVHDFRDSFGIEEPYRIPFRAFYEYLGMRTWKGKAYPAFSINYNIHETPAPVRGRVYPRRIQGTMNQIVYWDADQGQPAAYEENFRMVFDLSDGQTWEYRGIAEAEVVESPPMDKEEMAREIARDIEHIPDATVRLSDEGVVISLEDIQFDPDSAVLRRSEWPKLDRIAEILRRYPNRDILVGGHTALAGTAEGRLRLSEERAATVAEYLISRGVRAPERVVIRGYGAEQPVADNISAEGMRRNRRVEITILEN